MTLSNTPLVYRSLRIFHHLICLTLGLLLSCTVSASAQAAEPPGYGHVDSITFDGQRVTATGWAADLKGDQLINIVNLYLNAQTVYTGSFERFPRPDVASVTNRPDWINSGWKASFELPDDIEPGEYAVSANTRTRTGESFVLAPSASAQKLVIPETHQSHKKLVRTVKLLIAGGLLFLIAVFIKSAVITQWINRKLSVGLSEPVMFSLSILLVSFVFIGMGLTGSSVPLGQASSSIVEMKSTNIMGQDQPIRSDEWMIQTPLAIAQYNHDPQFPVVNMNVGEDGQNMMVTSMTSVPIAHITALAKPATWGFFVFDLRRALAWNWWFPIVGCFLALAFVLNRLSGTHWKQGFLFSALFCCAPYVVAWSFWPAYTVFFPCMIFLCALQILHTSSVSRLIPLGVLLGIALAGFVFILYPPWQVSVGYVFVAVTVGIVIRDRLYSRITPSRVLAYLVAAGVAGIIVGAWWLDASETVQAMAQTVYPGQRLTVGGTATLPLILRGFTNIPTLLQLNSMMSNQSEIASFYYLLLPLAALVLLRAVQNSLSALEWSLTVICGVLLYYMFIGFPVALAKYSLWGSSSPYRADLALGLASLILTHLLLNKSNQPAEATQTTRIFAFFVAVAWAYVVYRCLNLLDSTLTSGMSSSLTILILFITAALSYTLITNQFRSFIMMALGLSLASTMSFHPVNIAPSEVRLRPEPPATSSTLASALKGKRVVVMESNMPAMFLIASGVSVVNGVNYVPQRTLWKRMDPENKDQKIYNRYQHLAFTGVPPADGTYQLSNPHPDIVMVNLNLSTFDFRLSGANVVLAPDNDRAGLNQNKGLAYAGSATGWSWFNVRDN